jgi:hypothetical protein
MTLASHIALLAVCSAFAVRAEDVPTYSGDPKVKYGRVSQVVQPEFPKDALGNNLSGAIMVTGAINPAGIMESPRLVPDSPESEAFLPSLREVLPYWRFYTPTDRQCMPIDSKASVKVEFEAREGKPHVYLTYAASEPIPPSWQGVLPANQRPKIRYPRSMLREGREAIVFVRSEIGPDGNVLRIAVQSYPKPGQPPHGSFGEFEEEIKRAMSEWTYPKEASRPLRKVCDTVQFNLRN